MWEDGIGGADVQSAVQYPALSWRQPAVPTHRRLKGSLAGFVHSDEVQRFKEEKKAMSINWKDGCKKPWTQKNDSTTLEKESQEQLQYLEVPCPKALPSLSWLWLGLRTKNNHMGFVPQPGPRRLGPYAPQQHRWT